MSKRLSRSSPSIGGIEKTMFFSDFPSLRKSFDCCSLLPPRMLSSYLGTTVSPGS